tara:strand:- start:7308 stop:7556 length:249 start_codon:yes stop_codon:yes gene_type:complete
LQFLACRLDNYRLGEANILGRPMIATISSPCVSICALDHEDVCIGCHRTAREIRDWLLMDDDERLEVIAKAAERGCKNNPFA